MEEKPVNQKSRRFLAAIGLFGAIVCLILVMLLVPKSQPSEDTLVSAAEPATISSHISFLKGYGWEVDSSPCEIEELLIPKTFDDIYQSYNQIQKAQGMDLSKYRGQTLKRFSYKITNYPGYDGEVHANLICKDNVPIGGDICAVQLGGFLHGFRLQQ